MVGVLVQPKEPSSLSVRETMFQREREDEKEDLDAKITRRVQRAARRTAKREQLKRLHKAQVSLPLDREQSHVTAHSVMPTVTMMQNKRTWSEETQVWRYDHKNHQKDISQKSAVLLTGLNLSPF